MADQENWRAQRAAQLAGSPFAKPAVDALDATMPLVSPPPSSRPPAAAAAARVTPVTTTLNPGSPVTMRWLGIVATVIVVLGLALWAWVRARTPSPAAPVPAISMPRPAAVVPAPITVPAPAPAAGSPALSLPPVAATPSLPAAPPAPALPSAATIRPVPPKHEVSPRKRHDSVKKAEPPRAAAKHGRSGRSEPQLRTSTRTTPPPVVAPVTPKVARLPICQPEIVSRAPRPCRPSHERSVRKPFYSN